MYWGFLACIQAPGHCEDCVPPRTGQGWGGLAGAQAARLCLILGPGTSEAATSILLSSQPRPFP